MKEIEEATNNFDSLIDLLLTRPVLFVGKKNYELISAFIMGVCFTMASKIPQNLDDCLIGFEEWLNCREGKTINAHWSRIVLLVCHNYASDYEDQRDVEKEIQTLHQLIREFRQDRTK